MLYAWANAYTQTSYASLQAKRYIFADKQDIGYKGYTSPDLLTMAWSDLMPSHCLPPIMTATRDRIATKAAQSVSVVVLMPYAQGSTSFALISAAFWRARYSSGRAAGIADAAKRLRKSCTVMRC